MTSDLDQQIRALLAGYDIDAAGQIDHLTAAIRAVLDLDHFSGTTQWQRGWNEAHNAVRNAIAEELSITGRAEAEAVTAQPMDGRAEP